MNYMDELEKIGPSLQKEVFADIVNRLTDWFSAGGKETDPYVKQQLDYAKRTLER